MHESEIQPLHALILRANNIILLLFLGHGIPLPVPDLVAPNVEGLNEEEQDNVNTADREQDLVATAVQRLVAVAVYVRSVNIARLYEHVVKRCGGGTGTDRVGVCCVPADEDGVAG